ncbi:benzoyl-CoA reductase subunit C, putative (DUF630 and DUF632) [Tasmannia lanceolata]|uniref:benzoyl-CoA reductase subunit C, putative (DUF630 and DUF632) n=1 Tax=Tasmannia lanceolata TaxID=3420 RepID=UPI00406314B4
MGCVSSKIDKEGIVQRCKERKKLMKQLVGFRGEFALAQIAYLRALKNTGITLRQFTEIETLDLDNNTPLRRALPPSPPPPLPPSPPPPPPFSPDKRRVTRVCDDQKVEHLQEEFIEIDEENSSTPPPPPISISKWDFWDPFGPTPQALNQKKNGAVQQDEEEDWADTNTEFEEEHEDEIQVDVVLTPLIEKSPARELMDDNSSMVSWYTKDTDMAMVVWRSKKSLAGIVKELDDYFLKASAGVKEIAVLLDVNGGNHLRHNLEDSKRNSSKSAKVFSILSWSWSSKSLQLNQDAVEFHGAGYEACKSGSHSTTLDKLYAEEQRLYDEVKEEETAQLQYKKKTVLLQKQEAGDHDLMRIERTRSSIEILQAELRCLDESINRSCTSILKLRDEELHLQLVELFSGLAQMWRTMYECHQVQNHIAQQMNHLNNHPSTEPTTDYHLQATAQLETEVTAWYKSFCNLLKSQCDYVHTLSQWVVLTECLLDNHPTNSSPGIHALCEEWLLALNRLPETVASEAIKSFLSAIHSLVLQHAEERKLRKKADRLENRLEKNLNMLSKMENKFSESLVNNGASTLSPNNPLSVKRAKMDAFRKRVENEKSKYLRSVQVSHAMTLNNLRTSLPNIFQALTGFSSACMQAFEAIHMHAKAMNHDDTIQSSPIN